MKAIRYLFAPFFLLLFIHVSDFARCNDTIIIKKTSDFEISGDGGHSNWALTSWIDIPLRTSKTNYSCKAKLLYSSQGIYFLVSNTDKKLTATMQADFLDLWNEDVVEVFLWPDTSKPAYFEYEISPLNYELPLMIFNKNRSFLNSWIPFHYDSTRKTRHSVQINGGKRRSMAAVNGWTTEFFIPFKLLGLLTEPPHSGSVWRGNLYRIDYDEGETLFSWQPTSGDFHEYWKFGTLFFE